MSGNLQDPVKFSFRYGYAEMRAKIPKGKGLWPAFWMLPFDNTSKPEIDVVEFLGHLPRVAEMHYHYLDRGKRQGPGQEWQGPDFSQDWHTFAVDWQPSRIIWYVDGKERWRFSRRRHVSSIPMYLLVNLAVGGDWPGSPSPSTPFPNVFEIDYIRVWERLPIDVFAETAS